jgi:serine protease AprX
MKAGSAGKGRSSVRALMARWAAVAVVTTTMVAGVALAGPAGASTAPAKADRALLASAQASPSARLQVIVRKTAPGSQAAEGVVRRLGGTITHELPIIRGFSALIPARALSQLASSPAVARIMADGRIHMMGVDMGQYDSSAPNNIWRQEVKLPQVSSKYNGAGVGVAVLDTGVFPNADLGSRLVYNASFAPDVDVYDHSGHGTHMAGIIAGNGTNSAGQYMGVAPGANIISVKVAEPDGTTDVSVVIDGLQWIASNAATYNIRVVNLSFGTDGAQSYLLDPLDFAVEQIWNSGIVVVVAAGNRGPNAGTISKPGDDPYMITVGAADLGPTSANSDDTVAPFSSRGPTQDGFAKPDLVAPGISIVSDRDPGSWIDTGHPLARVGDYYFKGSGTSQATAVVSGTVALMIQADPTLMPNVVKAALTATAGGNLSGQVGAGAGLVNVNSAVGAAALGAADPYKLAPANRLLVPSTGTGTLEGSRGSYHVYADLDGDGIAAEMVTGQIGYNGTSWGGTSWGGTSWGGTSWGGTSWGGTSWGGTSWGGTSWGGTSWGGTSWGGTSWGGTSWGGTSWGGTSWGGTSWGGTSWGGDGWG